MHDPGEAARLRRDGWLIALCVAGSVLAHAALLVALPRPGERPPPPLETLRVTIEKTTPPRAETPPERAPRATAAPPVKMPQEKPRAVMPRERETLPLPEPAPALAPREVLSVPQQPSTPEPRFTVPAPEKSAEPPRETAKGARAATQPESAPPARPAAPRLVDAYRIDTPVRYRRTAEQGRVTLKVLVTREGRIGNVTIEKSSGHPNLDQNALQEARRWRFAPARMDSEPVEQVLTVHVDY